MPLRVINAIFATHEDNAMIDKNVPLPGFPISRGRKKYDFDSIQHGDSIHTATQVGAVSIRSSYKSYADRRDGARFVLRQAKVGADDPRGPGYRVFFLQAEAEAPGSQDSDEI